MTKPNMTTERVLDLIDIYGADLQAWPEAERASAEQLIAANPSAYEDAFSAARALDLALSGVAVPEPSNRLADSILRDAPQPSAAEPISAIGGWRRLFPSGIRLPAGAAIASLGVGLVTGYSYAGDSSFESYLETEANYTYAVEDSFEDWVGQTEDSE